MRIYAPQVGSVSKHYTEVKTATLDFAARFGFVTQSIFFDYLCPLQKTQKYLYWSQLKREGLIEPSRQYFEDVCYLTRRGRHQAPRWAVPSRSIYFVDHDATVARLYLELEQSGLLLSSFTEYELRSDKYEAFKLLGGDSEKYPDLLVDMKTPDSFLRIAVEVERSRKSNERYALMSLRYFGLRHVDLMLFCCCDRATGRAIEHQFNAEVYRKAEKIPTIFLISDFKKSGVLAEAKFLERRMTLKKLLLAALDQTEWGNGKNVENSRNRVHENFIDEKKCA